jgi:sugar lactone lactonase YvrE
MRSMLVGLVAVVGLSLCAGVAPAGAADVQRLVSFDAALGETPEGLAIDKRGTFYVSLSPIGQLRAIEPDGTQRVVATLPVGSGFGPLGLAVDAPGNVYVAVATFEAATHGVYRVTRDGAATRLPGTAAIAFPNGLTFDDRGNLYVTDSIQGAVWRIARGGSAEMWSQDALLLGDGSTPLPVPVGANGIAYRRRELFVTNTELGRIIRIPVSSDGGAGTPTLFAQSGALGGADGLALDVHGDMYVAVIAQSTIVRVPLDGGAVETIATAQDGIDWASSVAFGTGRGERKTLYMVNFAIGPAFGFPAGSGPGLLAVSVGVPGLPQP